MWIIVRPFPHGGKIDLSSSRSFFYPHIPFFMSTLSLWFLWWGSWSHNHPVKMLYTSMISYDKASHAAWSRVDQNSVNIILGAREAQRERRRKWVKKRYPIIVAQKQEDTIDLRSVFVSPLYPILKQALLFSLKWCLLKLPWQIQ